MAFLCNVSFILLYNRHDLVYFCQLYDDNVLGLCNLHIQTRLFGGKKFIKGLSGFGAVEENRQTLEVS